MGNEPGHSGVNIGSSGDTYNFGLTETFSAFVGAMAAAPFLQAIATHFGTKLAGTIDENTRTAVRRFLRRQAPTAQNIGATPQPIALRTERGWMLTIDPDLPAEALGQLLAVEGATSPDLAEDPAPRLSWVETAWRLVGVKEGAIAALSWDPETNQWN